MTVATTPAVPNATYELTVLDGNPSNRANLQFVFFYKSSDGNLRQKMSGRMRDAFYTTMSHYPILYGELQREKKNVRVNVSDASQQQLKPRYDEYDAHVLVADIAAAHYNWEMWPKELLSVCPLRPKFGSAPELPLVHAVVTWHPDGMGFLVSVDHSVLDGVGMGTLLKQWADMVREGQILLPVDFDHATVYEQLVKSINDEPQSDWFVDYIDSLPDKESKDTSNSEQPGITDTDPRAPQMVELALRANTHAMHMTAEAMKQLQSDSAQQASSIHLVYALMWKRYIAAMVSAKNILVADQPCLFNVIHSARHLVGRNHYVGNAVCPVYSMSKLSDLSEASMEEVARTLAHNMHTVTGSQWLKFSQMMSDPVRQAKFLTVFANPNALQLTVSNISRVGYFDTDFGFGAPSHVTVYPMVIPGFALWLPLDANGGLRIIWNLPEHVFNALKGDAELTRYVNILF
ncbi:hypothetical protein IWW38_003197 [Coemansia aciculifera]|uniref:Uncharacterized protein n=1 Tax=Coemansia aciculifera TaxID=417176 RepID=A0ACC1M2X3_9FUNG|nr:hypothetical protein IWW38_003197 [Coemansia aciculifera]